MNDHSQTLEDRIQTLLDGTISETEFHHLENELTDNPESRETYYKYVTLHQSLEFRLSRSSSSPQALNLGEIRLKHQRSKTIKFTALAAAALITCSLIILQVLSIQPAQPTQTALKFETSPGTRFTLTHQLDEKPKDPSTLEINSRLQLTQGTVELQFASGVNAIIQAPADIKLTSRNSLNMDNGVGWFNVPSKAIGFTIKTRELEIVDLGTQFGVISDPEVEDQVHVFKGKIQAKALYGVNEKIILTKDQAASIRPSGNFKSNSINPKLFLQKLPTSLPHQHWSFENPENLISANTIITPEKLTYTLHPTNSTSSFTPGKFGNALNLDGKTNFLETNWQGILGNNPRTVAFWIKTPNRRTPELEPKTTTLGIIAWGAQQDISPTTISNNQKWTIHIDYTENSAPYLNISFGGFWYATNKIRLLDNTWHHIAVVYSGESNPNGFPSTTLYFDGKQTPINPHSHPPHQLDQNNNVIINTLAETPFHLGAYLSREKNTNINPKSLLQAQIDELFIIEGTINQNEVNTLIHQNNILSQKQPSLDPQKSRLKKQNNKYQK